MITIFYYAMMIVVALLTILALRRAGFGPNSAAIDIWFIKMDIQAHGQRYQGDRSEVLHIFHTEKTGLAKVVTKRLCKTKSGRFYEIDITAEFCEVVGWHVIPLDAIDVQDFLDNLAPVVVEEPATILPQGEIMAEE